MSFLTIVSAGWLVFASFRAKAEFLIIETSQGVKDESINRHTQVAYLDSFWGMILIEC